LDGEGNQAPNICPGCFPASTPTASFGLLGLLDRKMIIFRRINSCLNPLELTSARSAREIQLARLHMSR
jgi:hypothetical protein